MSRIGLLIVGGLCLLVGIALVGVVWKLNRTGEVSTARAKEDADAARKDRSRSSPSPVERPTERREQTNDSTRTGEAVWRTLCFGVIVIAIGAAIWVALTWVDVCPRCGRWSAVRCLRRRVLNRKKCHGIVVRRGYSTRRGVIFGSKGAVPTVSHEQSEWEERVPVIRTTYEKTMECRFCWAEWTENEVKETEDFEPDEPLPPPSPPD